MEKILVEVEKYKAVDGEIFSDIEDCIHHEKMISGERKKCEDCQGTGEMRECSDMGNMVNCHYCDGRGWLEKQVVWR